MATEVQTQAGRCATHGTVEATREVPEMGFPFVVYAIWRAAAQRRPFRAQNAGQPSWRTEPGRSPLRPVRAANATNADLGPAMNAQLR
jgi:hypothetical protein